MDEADKDPKITPLVRRYSLQVSRENPNDTLSEALGTTVRREDESVQAMAEQIHEWRDWLVLTDSPRDEVLVPLERKRQEVVSLWAKFGHLFPDESISVESPRHVPQISLLLQSVQQAEAGWSAAEDKKRFKRRFNNFIKHMDDHSYLFEVIPSGDKYVSLITGVVSSVVKASINYQKIAECFSLALSEISSDLRSVRRELPLADTARTKQLVVELYVAVFSLLCEVMSWLKSKRKRLRASLSKSYYDSTAARLVDNIRSTISSITKEADYVQKQSIQEMKADIKDIKEAISNRHCIELRVLGNDCRDDGALTTEQKLICIFEGLGKASTRTLASIEEHHNHDDAIRILQTLTEGKPASDPQLTATEDGSQESSRLSIEEEDIASGDVPIKDEQSTRHDFELCTQAIVPFIEDGRVDISNDFRGFSALLPDEAIVELRVWIADTQSKMVWLEGALDTEYGCTLTVAALHLCELTKRQGLPCISYFGKRRYATAAATGLSHPSAGMISFLYSVITQLTFLLPPRFPASELLDTDQYQLLDGTLNSVPTAMSLINGLLKYAPPSLVWVLDGLDFIEDKNTVSPLKEFVNILREQEVRIMSKVCFTTEGNSLVLMRALSPRQRVDVTRMAQGRSSRLRHGFDAL